MVRAKLARQQANGLGGAVLYTSYANLGTVLIHGSQEKAASGDRDARERFREGAEFIRESVAVNAQAHFGREQWQAAFAEFLLAAMERPSLLQTFDFLGNRLDLGIEEILDPRRHDSESKYGRATDADFSRWGSRSVRWFVGAGESLDEPASWKEASRFRKHVTKVGAEKGWTDVDVPSHREPVAFDEPVLGIVGTWRQGGANPHFALALGETMLRVGQRYVAWAAFERASRMTGSFWPDARRQVFLGDHCRRRQAQIEGTLSPREVEGLRTAFEAELAHGEGYQRAYQKYEGEKIAAGVPLGDEKFYDDFHSGREPIASPSGPEEWFASLPDGAVTKDAIQRRFFGGLAWGALAAGSAGLAASLLCRRLSGRKCPTEPDRPAG